MSLKRSNRNKLILASITLAAICAFLYYKQLHTNQVPHKQALKIQIPVHIEKSVSAPVELPPPAESKPGFKFIDLAPTEASADDPNTSDIEVMQFEEQIDQLIEMLGDKVSLDHSDLTAIEVFISRLPDNLSSEELNMLGNYLNAYQENHLLTLDHLNSPEHLGNAEHNLGLIVTRLYSLKRQETHLLESAEPPADIEQTQALNDRMEQLRTPALGDELKHEIYSENQERPNELSPDKPADLINELRHEGISDEQIRIQIDERLSHQNGQNLKRLQSIEETWMRRYLSFLEDKQIILDAGLSEEDKALQIHKLYSKHYSDQELEAAIAFDKLVSTPENARTKPNYTQ